MIATALDGGQRSQLERLVVRARRLLEEDLAAGAEGRFGLHDDGRVEPLGALQLDPTAAVAREELVEVVDHLRSLGESPASAIQRVVREAAFTHLNRLIAVRIAEAVGLLPESLASGEQSAGFQQFGELAPLIADDYWTYLRWCGDELAADAPALFDPRNPLLALAPSPSCLRELVSALADRAHAGLWAAADTLGWTYQFFNTGDERRAMRDASAAPRDSRELAVRNQFFTPRYVVDFLVQNTLGRRLIESDPNSPLLDELPLLVDPPAEAGPALDLENVKILDPACGSGHFLLACYDLLERAWVLRGVEAGEAAPRIVRALWGVDIDVRCAQLASAAIILRARRHCRDLPLPRPNIVTARGLPAGAQLPEDADLTPELRRVVEVVARELDQASLLGVLLKAEERVETELRGMVFGTQPGTLQLPDDAYEALEPKLLEALQHLADSTTASVAERLFAAEADDAIRLLHVCRTKFDVVLMNPPFGLAPADAMTYLRNEYPDFWTDIYAPFVIRGRALLRRQGYLGAITSSQYFTTRKMQSFRAELTDLSKPLAIIDVGSGTLDAAVNTALLVLPRERRRGRTKILDLAADNPEDRPAALWDAIDNGLRSVDLRDFAVIEGSPFSLHGEEDRLSLWQRPDRFEPDVGLVRTGNNTFDNFRFIRCWWEVSPSSRATGWINYQKGGEYQPYYAPAHLVVDWKADGKNMREFGQARGVLPQVMQSSTHWFHRGLCYPRANRAFGVRIMPHGEIFSEKAIAIFPSEGLDPLTVLAVLNSTPVAGILQAFGRSRFIENSAVKRLPIGAAVLSQMQSTVAGLATDLVGVLQTKESEDETSAIFIATPRDVDQRVRDASVRAEYAAHTQAALDEAVQDALELPANITHLIEPRQDLLHDLLAPLEKRQYAGDLLSYLVGCAFGRWDVRIGRDPSLAPPLPDLFDQVPVCPPGMLLGEGGFPVALTPPDYPLELPPGRLLVDEAGHPWDIEARVLAAGEALFDDPSAMMAEMLEIFGRRSVREYLRRDFFKLHLSRYSKSRRKAPMYWPLTVKSGGWGIWVYAAALSRETLYAIADQTRRREQLASLAMSRLDEERTSGQSDRSPRSIGEQLASETRLAEERARSTSRRAALRTWDGNRISTMGSC